MYNDLLKSVLVKMRDEASKKKGEKIDDLEWRNIESKLKESFDRHTFFTSDIGSLLCRTFSVRRAGILLLSVSRFVNISERLFQFSVIYETNGQKGLADTACPAR